MKVAVEINSNMVGVVHFWKLIAYAEERESEVAAAAATQRKDQNLFEWKWIILGMVWHYGKWEYRY